MPERPPPEPPDSEGSQMERSDADPGIRPFRRPPPEDQRPPDDGSSYLVIRRLRDDPRSEQAWTYLDQRYRNRLLLYTQHRMGTKLRRHCEPDDIVAQAMIRAMQDSQHFQYSGPSSYFRWLCLKVEWEIKNKAREHERRGGKDLVREGDLAQSERPPDPRVDAPGPRTEVMQRDMLGRLISSLDRVPELYRRVLVARFLEDKSRTEIAEEFSLKPNTVSQQISRGLEIWRDILGEDPLNHI